MAVRDPRNLLGMAAACVVAFCMLLVLAYASPGARWLDAAALTGFIELQGHHLTAVAERLVTLGDPGTVIAMSLALVALAVARGRFRQAVAIAFLVGAASVSSQALKALLAYPREGADVFGAHVTPAAFPSGHSTAAMTLAAGAVIASPRAVRSVAAALGAVMALAVGYSAVTLGWHYPSDVVGGFLLATIWTLLLAAALQAAERRWPQRVGRTRVSAALTGVVDRAAEAGVLALALAAAVAAGTVALVVGLTRMDAVVGFAAAHTAAAAVGVAVATSAVLLLAGVTVALRRRD